MAPISSGNIKEVGFLLRGVHYGDHHRILSFLTAEHGRVDLIALGAKKSVRRFAGVLDFLNCLGMEYQLNPRGELGRLEHVELKDSFDQLRKDYQMTMIVLQWNQLLHKVLPVGHKVAGVFELLHKSMFQLSEHAVETIDFLFRRELLSRLGFHLELSRCVQCQRNDPIGYRFSPERGGLECTVCLPSSPSKVLGQTVSSDSESTKVLRKFIDESYAYFLGVEGLEAF